MSAEHPQRPAIEDDVMEATHQHVIVVPERQQLGAEERPGRQTKRTFAFGLQLGQGQFARIYRVSQILNQQWCENEPRNVLRWEAVSNHDRNAQGAVPSHHLCLRTTLNPGTLIAPRSRYAAERLYAALPGHKLIEEPDSFLRKGKWAVHRLLDVRT